MFRRKKKEEAVEPVAGVETPVAEETPKAIITDGGSTSPAVSEASAEADQAPVIADAAATAADAEASSAVKSTARARGNRVQKVGIVSSDKMTKTVVVRVDRLVLHRKYRRYVRRTSKFMAHDDLGSTTGDRVRIVETRPLSARKRWRVVEIVQKAAK
ncbi:MAG TPA: 30S ribosomal protein S17 [Pyrinomonadaceae bacterium]|nr:30S ribosomal protein S17 [Pyrinomonadaceae bacterium]